MLPKFATSNMHVLIVGAGLGGLSLAQTLRKQGVSFEIFDRDANEDSRFQGWAIGIHTYESTQYRSKWWYLPFHSIVDKLASSFPSDLPDFKEATNHLAPLNLPAQIGLYFPGREGRLGVEVRTFYRVQIVGFPFI